MLLAGVGKRCNLLRSIHVTRRKQLTAREKKMYEICYRLRRSQKQLQAKNMTLQKKLRLKKSLQDSIEELPGLNFYTRFFILSQISQQKKHAKGRRFTFTDKVFALSAYKRGPKTYRLLRKIFALPSRKVLMELLQRVPFDVGVNESIMASLQSAVAREAPSDRYCALMFDEMFLQCGLHYDMKTDTIDGFHNTGDRKKLLFADHAFVIMLRGVRRNWKQPVAYYFVHSGMSAPDIKKEFETVIRELQRIGLTIVATICDQGSCNPAAINMLITETREKLIKRKL